MRAAAAALAVVIAVAGMAGRGHAQEPTTLAREAQKELYRLGCSEEAPSGAWTQSSRRAAQKFLDRANARLPVEQPDAALLALLQNAKGFPCAQCPAGEAFNAAGQCIPKPLLSKPEKPAAASRAATEGAVSSELPTSDKRVEPHENGAPAQRTARAGSPESMAGSRYWRSMLRKVDRALGLE